MTEPSSLRLPVADKSTGWKPIPRPAGYIFSRRSPYTDARRQGGTTYGADLSNAQVRIMNRSDFFLHAPALALTLILTVLPAWAADRPVKVYILSGQSNMVGIGQVTGGGRRWGSEFLNPTLSVYPGKYHPDADYDKMTPLKTLKLESFGGVKPTPYPGGGTQVVRGTIQIKTTGVYELRPGYGASTHNIMEVDGQEVYRKAPGRRRGSHSHPAGR